MSATIGTVTSGTMRARARVESSSGQETRTISAPAISASRIWRMVPSTSVVRVLVIVCTLIGASPPTATEPTRIFRLLRRSMSLYGRTLIRSSSACSDAPDIDAGDYRRKTRRPRESVGMGPSGQQQRAVKVYIAPHGAARPYSGRGPSADEDLEPARVPGGQLQSRSLRNRIALSRLQQLAGDHLPGLLTHL